MHKSKTPGTVCRPSSFPFCKMSVV